jgi:hypothetical protein
MHPSVASGLEEGKLQANSPVDFYGKGIELQSELGVCHGNSLDMVIEWIKRNGLPAPGPARYNYNDILKKIAAAYNSNLWLNEGKVEEYKDFGCYPRNEYGFLRSWHLAPCQPFLDASWEGHVDFCKRIPQAVDYYIENHDCELSKALVEKRKWCLEHSKRTLREKGCFEKMFDLFDWFNDYELKEFADKILKKQSKDGNFPFIPPAEKGVAHHYKAASAWKPLGQQGDTCVNFCATSAFLLMMVGDVLEDDKYLAAAKKALDFAMPLNRPEGGDWWETPLHAPNVMSAGYMALAYYVGWKLFKDDKYLDKAIRSIRSLLPFVTLWETKECKMLYHPKPLFGATAWHAIDWTTRHILWQTLMLFELYGDLGIDWAEIDPEIDWATFHKGITHAGLRWIADSKDKDWMSQIAFEEKLHDMLLKGKLDMIVPDNYDPVTNKYYHLCVFIAPDTLASNIIQIMKKEEENKK